MMKKEIITTVTFLLLILFAFGMILGNAEEVRFSMLVGYKDLLPAQYGIFDIMKASTKNTENRIDTITRRMPLIDWYGAYKRLIGSRVMEDADPESTVYKMYNGQLTFVYPRQDVRQYVDNIAVLNEYLVRRNEKLLYIQAPFKVDKYDPQLPVGISDMANANADTLLRGLFERNVPYYDFREAIHDAHMPYADLFFNTDHHWTVETAFWAYAQVSKFLKENYGFEVDPERISSEHFTFTQYENCFLGMYGRRTGRYYGGVDDYTLVLPAFETDYNVKVFKSKDDITALEGSFYDTLIDKELIRMDQPVATNRFDAYLGHYPKIEIINNKVEKGKILIIEDSFGLPFSSLMSLNFHNTDVIDLRDFTDQTLVEYLENHQYDLVMFLYNPSTYEPLMFTFN